MYGRRLPGLQGHDRRARRPSSAPSSARPASSTRSARTRSSNTRSRTQRSRTQARRRPRGHDGHRMELRRPERGRQGRQGFPQGPRGREAPDQGRPHRGLDPGRARASRTSWRRCPARTSSAQRLLATLQAPLQNFVALLAAPRRTSSTSCRRRNATASSSPLAACEWSAPSVHQVLRFSIRVTENSHGRNHA